MTGRDESAYGTIVVCGGGCYGGYYVRQLARARAASAISFDTLLVVDQDPYCRVARLADAIARQDVDGIRAHGWTMQRAGAGGSHEARTDVYQGLPLRVACEPWDQFFRRWFETAIADCAASGRDAVVPSPLMPNLLADWVTTRLGTHRPDAVVHRLPVSAPPATPWTRTGTDASHYASFATWMCPINCIEPARCPETRGPREWSMPVAVRRATADAAQHGRAYDVVALFATTHRAYGVGMFDVADAVHADAAIAAAQGAELVRVLVASVSHCHGALAELESRR